MLGLLSENKPNNHWTKAMPIAPEIYIKNLNKRITINPAFSLLNNFLMQEIPIQTVCGGKAQCGRCRIKILEGGEFLTPMRDPERNRLGEELIKQNWRLSCQNHTLRDLVIEIPALDEDLSLPL